MPGSNESRKDLVDRLCRWSETCQASGQEVLRIAEQLGDELPDNLRPLLHHLEMIGCTLNATTRDIDRIRFFAELRGKSPLH